jgi:hypothetical protein
MDWSIMQNKDLILADPISKGCSIIHIQQPGKALIMGISNSKGLFNNTNSTVLPDTNNRQI